MRRCLPVLALVTTALLTSCSGPAAAPHASPDAVRALAALDASAPGSDPSVDGRIDDSAAEAKALEEAFWAPDPRGSTAQIALRFLQALQRQDDLAALRQLGQLERQKIAEADVWALHRVMNDVRRNAHVNGSGACGFAKAFDEDDVLVACGQQRVMVHLDPSPVLGGGVEVLAAYSWIAWPKDPYRHAHTLAYSSVDL
ncbi:MAG: hypothetical protein M3P04_12475 [Actinomycetota bacterium]|nr:hypothetical protein [Actinomycetota bacterium]